MKTKVVVLVALALTAFTVQAIWSQAVQPEVSADLTLHQFADPSIATDTTSRMLDRITQVFSFFWVTYVVCGIFWLRNDMVSLYKRLTQTEEKEVK